MRCVSGQVPHTWNKWLSFAKYWYNTNYHNTLEITPFQALYRIPPLIHILYLTEDSLIAIMDQLLNERGDMFKVLQFQLKKA